MGTIPISKRSKEKAEPWSWCPVNRKAPSKLTRDSFKRMCMHFQERARSKSNCFTKGISGWNDVRFKVCDKCPTGCKVKDGLTFTAPMNIEFVEPHKPRPMIKRRKK